MRPALVICAMGLVGAAGAAPAQDALQAQIVRSAITRHYVPRVAAFGAAANDLVRSIDSLCKAPADEALRLARRKWIDAMLAWESANAVVYGPLLTRKSAYRIDFWPVRRYLIEEALKAPPADVAALDLVGGPAKGMPAIEWLLWERAARAAPSPASTDGTPLLTDPARCAYARVLALDVANEARILIKDFGAVSASGPTRPEDKGEDPFALLLNQTLGALEQLMLRKMEIPASGHPGGFPRALSGETLAAWNAQWSSIRNLLLGENRDDGLLALLRARGSSAIADKMQAAAGRVTTVLGANPQASREAARQVAQELASVRTVLRSDVAGALKIPIQFTDKDGLD